jgi:hypothetical protein
VSSSDKRRVPIHPLMYSQNAVLLVDSRHPLVSAIWFSRTTADIATRSHTHERFPLRHALSRRWDSRPRCWRARYSWCSATSGPCTISSGPAGQWSPGQVCAVQRCCRRGMLVGRIVVGHASATMRRNQLLLARLSPAHLIGAAAPLIG